MKPANLLMDKNAIDKLEKDMAGSGRATPRRGGDLRRLRLLSVESKLQRFNAQLAPRNAFSEQL